jgi:hypothetical protein
MQAVWDTPTHHVSLRYFRKVLRSTHPEVKVYKNCHLAKCGSCIRLKEMMKDARDNRAKQQTVQAALTLHREVGHMLSPFFLNTDARLHT